jgi:DNA-binding GntR family transcriptional regulator
MADEVAATLRDMILEGELHHGERRTQEELATELGVSTMPVREALLKLTAAGLVEATPNRSFRVVRISPEDMFDVYWMHAMLSAEITRRACERRDDGLVESLKRSEEAFLSAAKSGDMARIEEANWQFHRDINMSADSPRLLFMLRTTLRFIPEGAYTEIPEWIKMAKADHRRIVRAFVDGDPDAAAVAAREHVEGARDLLLRAFDESGFWHRQAAATG